jgi:hypothetical protein
MPERSMGTWQIKVRFLDGSTTTLLYRRGMPPPAASGEVRLPYPRDAKKQIRLQIVGDVEYSPPHEGGLGIWEFEATEL